MIRLATVFSGIGAIEHALQRMNLDHRIVFACDNGDIDIFAKDVGMDIDGIKEELTVLEKTIEKIQFDDEIEALYKNQLAGMLREAVYELKKVSSRLESLPSSDNLAKRVLETILGMPSIKPARKKEYSVFLKEIAEGSDNQKRFRELQVILEICNDFKKDNDLSLLGQDKDYLSSDGIEWRIISKDLKTLYERLESVEGKKIIRRIQDLSQRTSQLHEKINYMDVQGKLKAMGDNWEARKAYVDSLYAGQESRNKVKQSYMGNYSLPKEDFHWNVAFLDGRQYAGYRSVYL